MAHRSLLLPSRFPFKTRLSVRITDLNYGGHVGNDRFLSFLHEIRVQFLRQVNILESTNEGVGLILTDVTMNFLAQSFHGDELDCATAAANPGASRFDLYYKIERDGAPVLRARTGMACFDYQRQRVCRMTDQIRDNLPWSSFDEPRDEPTVKPT